MTSLVIRLGYLSVAGLALGVALRGVAEGSPAGVAVGLAIFLGALGQAVRW